MPVENLAMLFAVAGAMTYKSAQSPSSTWLVHSPEFELKNSRLTGFLESVESVSGLIKSVAEGVIITFTCAPSFISDLMSIADLYAAILPVTPIKIFLPRSIRYSNNIPESLPRPDTCRSIHH